MAGLGTRLYTALHGKYVGDDEFGNKYYCSKSKKEGAHVGRGTSERRWVVYSKVAEPSLIPPYWHGWIHYISDDIPTEKDKKAQYKWEQKHTPNLTGTDYAYLPPGHIARGGKREKATGDYEAWEPK